MTSPNAVTQAEFARMEGKARSYITALKNAGRLVLTDKGLVDVEASRARIAETSDPNRDDVAKRWADQRPKPQNIQQEKEPDSEKIGSYQAARAVKEKFAAMTAKMEYERAIGKLVEKSDVETCVSDVVTLFRQRIENLPHRIAPELVGKNIDAIRGLLKQEIHQALAEMEIDFSKQIEIIGEQEK